MSFCYDMLQDIKRMIKEDFSQEYRNYLTLQQKIREDTEKGLFKFVERTQGAEMSLFIENIFFVEKGNVPSHYKGDNADDLVSQLLAKKQLIETVEKENKTVAEDFMQNVIGFISDENDQGGNNYAVIGLSPKQAQSYLNQINSPAQPMFKQRNSVDVDDSLALKKIFSIPNALKVKNKFKERIRDSVTIEPLDDLMVRSVSNNLSFQPNFLSKNTMRAKVKVLPKRSVTINTDELSDESSDLDF